MKRIVRQLWSKQFGAFLMVGGLAAIVNVISRAILDNYLGFQASIFAAYMIGMATAFLLNKYFVFEESHHASVGHEAFYFFLVNMVGVLLVWLVTMGLANIVFPWWAEQFPALAVPYPRLMAHMIGVTSPAVTSYFGHKHLSFRRKPAETEA
ncbi:MAG: GtrA family protein [Pseudomonadota bacterium]